MNFILINQIHSSSKYVDICSVYLAVVLDKLINKGNKKKLRTPNKFPKGKLKVYLSYSYIIL